MIQYLHRDKLVSESGLPADLTLLEYIRDHLGLRGTKEGCASGDCGACTVVLVEEVEGSLQYQTVNSCICPVGELHQRELICVDDLGDGRDYSSLHPVQRALVDAHASQCGFCTPGFVMSAFALLKNNPAPSREAVELGLAGNLCRCTGYRPIIDALISDVDTGDDSYSKQESQRIELLQKIEPQDEQDAESGLALPGTLDEVHRQHLLWPDAAWISGGTDLGLELTQRLVQKPRMIALTRVQELSAVRYEGPRVTWGSSMTYTQMLREANTKGWSALSDLLHLIAADQIRNRGTLGGNFANASPIGDLPPVFLALDAQLALWSARHKSERRVPADQFFTDYRRTVLETDELIKAIEFEEPASEDLWIIEKISKRKEDDISAVLVAICARIEADRVNHIRIGLGGMAATPTRAYQLETALTGERINQISEARVLEQLEVEFAPMSDQRASAGYRLAVTAAAISAALMDSLMGRT